MLESSSFNAVHSECDRTCCKHGFCLLARLCSYECVRFVSPTIRFLKQQSLTLMTTKKEQCAFRRARLRSSLSASPLFFINSFLLHFFFFFFIFANNDIFSVLYVIIIHRYVIKHHLHVVHLTTSANRDKASRESRSSTISSCSIPHIVRVFICAKSYESTH